MITSTENPAPVERRSSRRISGHYLRFYSPVPGTILNLSDGGMCLETFVKLTPGASCAFRIRHRSRIVTLRGEVRWCRLQSSIASSNGKTLSLFRAGMVFSKRLAGPTLRTLTEPVSG